jgi:hypothetical protein
MLAIALCDAVNNAVTLTNLFSIHKLASIVFHLLHLTMIATKEAIKSLAKRKSVSSLVDLPMARSNDQTAKELRCREYVQAVGFPYFGAIAQELESDPLVAYAFINREGKVNFIHGMTAFNSGPDYGMKGVYGEYAMKSPFVDRLKYCWTKVADNRSKFILSLLPADMNGGKFIQFDDLNPLAQPKKGGGEHTLKSLHFPDADLDQLPNFALVPKLFPFRIGQHIPIGLSVKNDCIMEGNTNDGVSSRLGLNIGSKQ